MLHTSPEQRGAELSSRTPHNGWCGGFRLEGHYIKSFAQAPKSFSISKLFQQSLLAKDVDHTWVVGSGGAKEAEVDGGWFAKILHNTMDNKKNYYYYIN